MQENRANLPAALPAYIEMTKPNEVLRVARGPFKLVGRDEGQLSADLLFRWLPSTTLSFSGPLSAQHLPDLWAHLYRDSSGHGWTLQASGDLEFSAPVQLTHITFETTSLRVRGFVQGALESGQRTFDRFRFCLVNFPDYNGKRVHYTLQHDSRRARLEGSAADSVWRIDVIPGAAALRERVKREPGFVISHVGEWIPHSGTITAADAGEALRMLHFWFGLLRGAWAGPVFPQGLIILAQVALELLAWVRLVEAKNLHSRADFKRLSAAGRIRALLHHSGVPTELPDYLTQLANLCDTDAFDGPGVITRVRNALVHAGEKRQASATSIGGGELLECGQLALNYVELAVLSACGYSGHYVRRGRKSGVKGDDEIRVPWVLEGPATSS